MPRKQPVRGSSSFNDDPGNATRDDDQNSDSETDNQAEPSMTSLYNDAVNLPAHQTKHLAELMYRFPSIDTSFRLVQRNDTNSTGSSLWLSSQVLSSYLIHTYAKTSRKGPPDASRKWMLELGSGTGLLSLLMARLGWEVVATDIPPVLDTVLKPNIDAGLYQPINIGAAKADQAHVNELDWTIPPQNWRWHPHLGYPTTAQLPASLPAAAIPRPQSFDLIVTADTIYEPSLVHPLLLTIAHLYQRQGQPRPTVLLALERRDPSHITEALRTAHEQYSLPFKQIPSKRIRKIFDSLGDGATWSRDDWDGVEIWKL
ncbi:hypothetical protein PHSY_007485 [Pseudozyma hubeiensis SY62]|uniref:Uncharacterized protein n=1 Tax=Pseudozyma hubeiensis (strain SY62) TaxID=1305764 RepID=R9PF78_PSEHS|nr:hypothetical protein PHSY_007485 [Pseudozyma hubeiensis SY62]GAC99882.1 hypothetical protein PHSY_007485 [Pseudozyma hubeiensis SY62]